MTESCYPQRAFNQELTINDKDKFLTTADPIHNEAVVNLKEEVWKAYAWRLHLNTRNQAKVRLKALQL